MIEWILTDNNALIPELIMVVIIFAILIVMFLFAFAVVGDDLKTETRGKITYSLLVIWMFLMFSMTYVEKHIVTENLTEGNWVQIYSNDQSADISIYFSSTSHIKAGEELDSANLSKLKNLYSRNAAEDVEVAASKDGAEERRVVKLDGRNISIPLDKDYSMKITKIEYQKIVGQRKTLFGHAGNVSKSYLDGQIKVTVNGEKKDESLKELFDGKKQ